MGTGSRSLGLGSNDFFESVTQSRFILVMHQPQQSVVVCALAVGVLLNQPPVLDYASRTSTQVYIKKVGGCLSGRKIHGCSQGRCWASPFGNGSTRTGRSVLTETANGLRAVA